MSTLTNELRDKTQKLTKLARKIESLASALQHTGDCVLLIKIPGSESWTFTTEVGYAAHLREVAQRDFSSYKFRVLEASQSMRLIGAAVGLVWHLRQEGNCPACAQPTGKCLKRCLLRQLEDSVRPELEGKVEP